MAFNVRGKGFAIGVVLLMLLGGAQDVQAQWTTKWLAAGDFQHPYLSGGAEPEGLAGANTWFWPGIKPGTGNSRWKAVWVSRMDYTDENGTHWEVRNSHIGPRILGIGEMFDVRNELIAKFEPPTVQVDGFDTFLRATVVDEVDPAQAADQVVDNVVNTSVGITMRRKAQQFSGDHHDDYHLIEYTFTNTGNVDDDPQIELEEQEAKDVYFVFNDHPTANSPASAYANSESGVVWGSSTMNDAVGEGFHDYGVDFRGQFSWLGYVPSQSEFNTLGGPLWFDHGNYSVNGDTLGRLGAAHMVGTVTIHADGEAHPPGESLPDDRDQPRLMSYMEHNWSTLTTGNSHTNEAKMEAERRFIENGADGFTFGEEGSPQRVTPTHAYMVEPDGNFVTTTGDPAIGTSGGWAYVNGYGPYDMAPGEEVKIVVAEGAAGLSEEARWEIGRRYKASGGDDSLRIAFDANGDGEIDPETENMVKNAWVMTARDSLFQLFEGAIENYEADYDIPRPPLPPSRFEVRSSTNQIELSWDVYEELPQGYDSAEPPQGWEIWRAQKAYHGIVTALRIGEDGRAIPDSSRAYRCIAGCPGTEQPELAPDARSYTDSAVERGLSYFYYIQGVGEVNEVPTGNTPTGVPLKSSRYWTQTYEPAFLRREPGEALSSIRVVPNPYNLASDTDVRFGDQENKIAFYGLPGEATIQIYTEIGELVETIEHTDGSGDEIWNLTTSSRQLIVSGIYFAVITNNDSESDSFGEQITRKIVIIR